MKGLRIALITLCVAAARAGAAAELAVVEEGPLVTVKSDSYSVTFDRSRGGTITQLGARNVEQRDEADGFVLAADKNPEILIPERSPDRVTITVKASYTRDGQKSASEPGADYTYTFLAASPVVRLRALLRQQSVRLFADVSGYPKLSRVTVLALGSESAWSGSVGGEKQTVTVHFAPGAEKPFDLSKDDSAAFDKLALPVIAKKDLLLSETFKNTSRWTNVSGTWEVADGALWERSPAMKLAWTVAGESAWADYIVETAVRTQAGESHVYLCARWRDVDNFYAVQYLEHPAFAMRIVRMLAGQRTVLAEADEMPDLRQDPHTRLGLEVVGNRLRAYRDGEVVLEAFDSSLAKGRIALGEVGPYNTAFSALDVYSVQAAEDEAPRVALSQPVQRHAFYREEKSASVDFLVTSHASLDGASVTFSLQSDLYPTRGDLVRSTVDLEPLKAKKPAPVAFDFVPGDWRAGDYVLLATVRKGEATLAMYRAVISIRRKPNADRMLVNSFGSVDDEDPARLAENGFNQLRIWRKPTLSRWTDGNYKTPDNPDFIFDPSQDAVRQHVIDRFDDCIRNGMWGYLDLEYLRRVPEGVTDAYALKRDGKSFQDRATNYHSAGSPRPNPWHPKTAEVICDYYRRLLSAWKDMPAWHAIMLNSESERSLDPYGNDYWLDMAKKDLGFEVPADVTDPWGPKGYELPADGIIESDNPYYRFYRWWWERGEGQGRLHAAASDAVKEVRPDIVSWHDPALRQPFVRGRLAGLDAINHWSYSWPNVGRFGLIADDLRLAASPGQERMFMFQLIVWGNVFIPPQGPHWSFVKRSGKMYLPAHSPATIREGTWLALSRGVSGVMYYYLMTVDRLKMTAKDDDRVANEGIGYSEGTYSNPDTLVAIRDMSKRVIQPYGMLIKHLTPAKGEVAMLLSTANMVMTGSDSEGYVADQAGHMYVKLASAHVAVDPLYEIDLETRGLDGYKAVALPCTKVLPRHIYDIIVKFVAGGGLVIADQFLVPKFANVVTLPRQAGAWVEAPLQEEDLAQSKTVHEALDGRLARYADCDSPSVILNVMEDGDNRYLFAVNHLRETGDYGRPWAKVLDNGVPQTTRVKVRKSDCVIYDALDQKEIEPDAEGDWLSWEVSLGPGDGKLFAIRPKRIARVRLAVTPGKRCETPFTVAVAVEGVDAAPLPGLFPLRATIRDSQGVENEYSDYYLANDGKAEIAVPIARNDASGSWEVRVRELTTGVEGGAFFRVPPPE
ncbi:MAG: hypothetical protein V2A58_03965 [Planctomycetota bacterium]